MRPTLLWGSFASGSFFVYCPPIFWAADGTEMTCFILLSEVQCRQSEIWKTLPVPVGKRHRQGLGSVSDHRPHHTPPRTTRKQHGQRGPKMKWSGAETAKNGRKCSKKVSGACSHPRGRGFESHQVHQRQTCLYRSVFSMLWYIMVLALCCHCAELLERFCFSNFSALEKSARVRWICIPVVFLHSLVQKFCVCGEVFETGTCNQQSRNTEVDELFWFIPVKIVR